MHRFDLTLTLARPRATSAKPAERASRYETEELAALRFSIILTARWEASDDESPSVAPSLRGELALLRNHYGDKIDEIAMTFGVAAGDEDEERSGADSHGATRPEAVFTDAGSVAGKTEEDLARLRLRRSEGSATAMSSARIRFRRSTKMRHPQSAEWRICFL